MVLVSERNNNFASQIVSDLFVSGYSISSQAAILSRCGKIVVLSLYIVTIGDATSGAVVMTLPVGYRPTYMRYCDVPVTGGGANDEIAYTIRVSVGADGVIKLGHAYTRKTTHPYLMGTLIFSM